MLLGTCPVVQEQIVHVSSFEENVGGNVDVSLGCVRRAVYSLLPIAKHLTYHYSNRYLAVTSGSIEWCFKSYHSVQQAILLAAKSLTEYEYTKHVSA